MAADSRAAVHTVHRLAVAVRRFAHTDPDKAAAEAVRAADKLAADRFAADCMRYRCFACRDWCPVQAAFPDRVSIGTSMGSVGAGLPTCAPHLEQNWVPSGRSSPQVSQVIIDDVLLSRCHFFHYYSIFPGICQTFSAHAYDSLPFQGGLICGLYN